MLFRFVRKHEASALELRAGSPPSLWLRGEFARTDLRPLTEVDMERLLRPILWPDQWERLNRGEGVAFAYSVDEGHRFWVTLAKVSGGLRLSAQWMGGT
jgi:Tfp pilus assembly pilus retraction ATPase PilT